VCGLHGGVTRSFLSHQAGLAGIQRELSGCARGWRTSEDSSGPRMTLASASSDGTVRREAGGKGAESCDRTAKADSQGVRMAAESELGEIVLQAQWRGFSTKLEDCSSREVGLEPGLRGAAYFGCSLERSSASLYCLTRSRAARI
jgi:hypothetical protein